MADLRTLLEGLGLTNVRTYLQSGNAVFEAGGDAGTPQQLADAIAIRIERDVGPRVGVLVLRAAALEAVVAANPFLAVAEGAGERRRAVPARHLPLRLRRRRRLRRGPRDGVQQGLRVHLRQARAARRRRRGGGVRRRAAARRARHLPQAAARLRAHQAEQRLVRAQARYRRDHSQLADGARARRAGEPITRVALSLRGEGTGRNGGSRRWMLNHRSSEAAPALQVLERRGRSHCAVLQRLPDADSRPSAGRRGRRLAGAGGRRGRPLVRPSSRPAARPAPTSTLDALGHARAVLGVGL